MQCKHCKHWHQLLGFRALGECRLVGKPGGYEYHTAEYVCPRYELKSCRNCQYFCHDEDSTQPDTGRCLLGGMDIGKDDACDYFRMRSESANR